MNDVTTLPSDTGREEEITLDDLARFHPAAYLDELQRAAGGDLTLAGLHMGLGGPDTPVFPDLFEYGAWACGSALTAAGLLADGRMDVVFSLAGGFWSSSQTSASLRSS